MAVNILGSVQDVTVVGSPVNVTTGTSIQSLPTSSPVTITGSGSNADSYWNLASTTLLPENLGYKVGLGVVDTDTVTDNYFLLYDTVAREIKKIDATTIELKADTRAWSTITGTPTSLSGYGILDSVQPLDADLTAIAALGFTSTAFLKKTAANTWALDTNTYSTTGHTHPEYSYTLPTATNSTLGGVKVGNTLTISNGVLDVIPGGSVTCAWGTITGTLSSQGDLQGALDAKAPLSSPIFTGSFGFATAGWRFEPNGTVLEIKYNGVKKASLSSSGTLTCVEDVVAYG